MRRREFITLIGGAATGSAVLQPLAARAQQLGKLPAIGFLGADAAAWNSWTAAFVTRLRELGWIEGRTITIHYRWDEGRPERDAEIAAEFVQLNVDVMVTNGIAAHALKHATAVIPIVFAIAPDPIGGGLVASLARPGGNITGQSLQATDLAGKRLGLLREISPGLRRLALMFDADFAEAKLEAANVRAAADALGIEMLLVEIRRAEDIAPAFAALQPQTDALYVVGDGLTVANRTPIVTFALGKRLPSMFGNRTFVKAGGLMSYGPDFPALFRHAAELVDNFCTAPSLATSRSSSRPNSISPSISQPPRRLVLLSRNHSWCAPTR